MKEKEEKVEASPLEAAPTPSGDEVNKSSEAKADAAPSKSWEDFGFDERLLKLILAAGYKTPTPIQEKSLPYVLQGRDVIGSARTGSGKTATFALPLIQKLLDRRGTYALILAPTREIALQTQEAVEKFGEPLGVKSLSLIGGTDVRADTRAIQLGPQILVGTPGRICDHLSRGNLWLEYMEFLVLDEADRMLDMGFAKELNQIVDAMPASRQTLLFSATMPPPIEKLCNKILKKPVRVSIGQSLSVSQNIDHRLFWVNEETKFRELRGLLEDIQGSVIIFTKTKDGATDLWRRIHAAGFHESTYISSNKSQAHREEALEGFKSGKYNILVATDVAARGIHVENVRLVVNYDLPQEPEDYIHRIGRTGRKDAHGLAISLVTAEDRRQVEDVEAFLKERILEDFSRGFRSEPAPRQSARGGGKRHGSSSGRRSSGSRGPRR